jgi:hypothetical protein
MTKRNKAPTIPTKKSRLLTDETEIKETIGYLAILAAESRNQFEKFKVKRGLRSRAAIEALGEDLDTIVSEIGFLSDRYWTFWRKLRAQDRNIEVMDDINNWLGWLIIEIERKQDELFDVYPQLID